MSASSQNTILVIDPDPSIRALIVAVMRREGYMAEAAGNSDEALRLHRSARHAAVVVDPRPVGGSALLDKLQDGDTRNPNLIVVTTPDDADETYDGRPAVHAVLYKPFFLEDLTAAVEACCNGAS